MASLPPFEDIIDVNQLSLYISLASIAFNPIFWNIVARNGVCFIFFNKHLPWIVHNHTIYPLPCVQNIEIKLLRKYLVEMRIMVAMPSQSLSSALACFVMACEYSQIFFKTLCYFLLNNTCIYIGIMMRFYFNQHPL